MLQSRKPGHNASGYFATDTIAAPVTSSHGAVSVLRISGPEVQNVVLRVVPDAAERLVKNPRKSFLARVVDPSTNEVLDEAMALFFKGPGSFTGEDTLELHCHGGSWISSRILGVLSVEGIRMALPGEFSFRAVRNGKMELSQAQAVADLISAKNGAAASLALEKLSGKQHEQMLEIAEELRVLAMLGEVGIDFADQDVEEVRLSTLQGRASKIRSKLAAVQATYKRGKLIQEGFRVVFLGLPNSGKSSFFNALLGENRSIVSDVAGTTRDSVRESLTLSGSGGTVTLRLEDTAGVRQTEDQIEQLGIARTWAAAQDADLVLWVVSVDTTDQEWSELRSAFAMDSGIAAKSLAFLTKSDLLTQKFSDHSVSSFFQEMGLGVPVPVSALTGQGISECIDVIVDYCNRRVTRDPGEVLLTREEHVQSIRAAIGLLDRAESAPGEDLFASDVRHALGALSPIIGETLTEEILGRIFSSFCIGK